MVFASLIAVAAAAAAHLRRLRARRRHEHSNQEGRKKSEKKKGKISGAIGISPFSHSIMLPGYTNLEASSDGILLFRKQTLTINSWMMAFCEAPTTTPEIGISVYKLPETQALTLVTESVLCVRACACVFFFDKVIDEMIFKIII